MEERARRKSIMVDDMMHETTKGNSLPTVLCIMEALYMFVLESLAIYTLYGLAEFVIDYDGRLMLHQITEAKLYGCCLVLIAGIICDSYIGRYYSVLALLVLATFLPTMYFIVVVYPFKTGSSQLKIDITKHSNVLWGIIMILQPLRVTAISTAVLEQGYFVKPRNFFSLLVLSWHAGGALGGIAIFFCESRRLAYAIVMGLNTAFMLAYFGFWLFIRGTLTTTKGPIAVAEKAIGCGFCIILKNFDRICLRKVFFKGRPGWFTYRCFSFSDSTVFNARSILGIVLVTLPLISYFTMVVVLRVIYYVQMAMLSYERSQFPFLTLKSLVFVLVYPPFEYIGSKFLGKWFKKDMSKNLTLIGVGAFIVSFALIWTSVVQNVILRDLQLYTQFSQGVAHVTITNCLAVTVGLRGAYYNNLKSHSADEWFSMEPMTPLYILRVPKSNHMFQVEFGNENISLYDEYLLPLVAATNNWFMLIPQGIVKLDPDCFLQSRHMAMNPKSFSGATVCIMCGLGVCNGCLTFRSLDTTDIFDVPFESPMTSKPSKVVLSGRYNLSIDFGGTRLNEESVIIDFKKLGSYLIIIREMMEFVTVDAAKSKSHMPGAHDASSSVEPFEDLELPGMALGDMGLGLLEKGSGHNPFEDFDFPDVGKGIEFPKDNPIKVVKSNGHKPFEDLGFPDVGKGIEFPKDNPIKGGRQRSSLSKRAADVTFLRSKIVLSCVETHPSRTRSVVWMYPTVVLHAIAEVFVEVSLLTYLYSASPHDVRATIFCFATSLALPAYIYFNHVDPLTFQEVKSLYFFSLGSANFFFMIVYFFGTVYYVHRYLRAPPREEPPTARGSYSEIGLFAPGRADGGAEGRKEE